jgi:hypothetical protein
MQDIIFQALSQIEDLSNAIDEGGRIDHCRDDTVTLILENGSEMNVYLGPVQELLDAIWGMR